MKVIVRKTEKARVRKVRDIILSAGNQIASVWFRKRSDGSLRKMAYRLHVANPTYAPTPNSTSFKKRKAKDSDNQMITVLDVNKVIRSKSGRRKGKICGRGAYRSIPMENVIRVCVKGEIYRIRNK